MATANICLNALLVTGAWLLLAALLPIRQLIRRLPQGNMRRQWRVLGALICVFILAYLAYMVSRWHEAIMLSDWVAAAVFLLSATFILQVNILALQTTIDVRRLATLEEENIIDPLMKIFNRRYLDQQLDIEVAEARRYQQPLSVLLLDLDHFKQINDTYGHPAGDQILKRCGEIIVNTVRETDLVARYGGEELFIIAPHTNLVDAANLANRLRQALESSSLTLPQGNQPSERITASIGVACLGPHCITARALIRSVDAALYRAKREGRNRVITHDHGDSVVQPEAIPSA